MPDFEEVFVDREWGLDAAISVFADDGGGWLWLVVEEYHGAERGISLEITINTKMAREVAAALVQAADLAES